MKAFAALRDVDPRTRRLLAVGAATYLGRLGGALAPLICVPLAREMLDAERFGVWMMLSGLLAFFAFADLGIGYALLNRVTGVQAGEPTRRRVELARELVAGYACTVALGLALLLAWGLWCGLATDASVLVGAVSLARRPDVVAGMTAFAVLFALNLPASLIQKVQLGAQDGHWVGLAQFGASAVTLVALPLALVLGSGLATLMMATLGVQMLVNLASTLWWLHHQQCLPVLRLAALQPGRVLALVRTGMLFFGLQLTGAMVFQSDSIVITQLLGPAAYGDFSVVQRLFLLLGAGLAAGISGLWPAFGDAVARGELQWVRKTLFRAWLITGLVALLAVLVLCAAIDLIVVRWLHESQAPAQALCVALATWTVVEAVGAVSGACMNGANLMRVQLMFGALTALLAFGSKWWAVAAMGPIGAVLATLVAYLLVGVPSQFFIFKRLFSTMSGQMPRMRGTS